MKNIVVSGGTKGIGRAIIEIFAQNGYTVFTCARNQDELNVLQEHIEWKYNVKCYTFKADVSLKNEVMAFGNFILKTVDKIDILVNNAGYFVPGDIHSEEDGVLESMIETNLYSAYYLTRSVIHNMISNHSGQIFNICSIASITAYDNGGSYSISKYAMYGMTRNLREEMKDKGIKVTAILPGATLSASWEGVDVPKERLAKASDVADVIWSASQLSNQAVVEEIIVRPQLGDL